MISLMPTKSSVARFAFVPALALAVAGLAAAPQPEQPMPDTLDLKSAVGFALENNFIIREARERIRQQAGVEIQVRAREIPNVSASGNYTGNAREISQYTPQNSNSWNISLQARQVLFAGGGVLASVKNARLTREAAELEMEGIINQQLLAVRTQFYTVLLAKEKITVQEENVRLLEKQLQDAQSRYNAGSTSNFDVLRAQVALANGQPPLIQARNDYRIAIEQLRQVLGFVTPTVGVDVARVPDLVGSLAVGEQVKIELTDALEAAHAKRPELQQLARLDQAAEQNIKAVRAGALPEFDLVGGYLWTRSPFSGSFSDNMHGWTAGVQAQWNIFDGRATAGRVVQARSQLEQAKLSLAQTTLAVDVQVRQAYSSLVEAWELVQASAKTIDQAQEALRLANVRYGVGTATQLDVLTSQVALTEARINELQADYGYNVALATLRQAMGQADEFVSS
jgi:outer membrane protein TolC